MKASPTPTIEDLLEAALEGEARGRDFYHRMSLAFGHDSEAAGFWRDLVKDEAEHFAILKRIRRALSDEQLLEPVDPAGLKRAVSIPDALAEKVVRSISTLYDALEIAHQYENSEINHLFQFFTTRFVSAEERRTFLLREIRDHQAKLTHFAERLGGRERAGAILVRWPTSTGQ